MITTGLLTLMKVMCITSLMETETVRSDKLKIDYGDLNQYVKITYHDGGDVWSYGMHFKYVNIPDHMILQDNDGYEYDYYPTDLDKALMIRNRKTIIEY